MSKIVVGLLTRLSEVIMRTGLIFLILFMLGLGILNGAHANVITTFEAAMQPGGPAAGWSYLWNSGGSVGTASNYTPLLPTPDDNIFYDSDGDGLLPGPPPADFVYLGLSFPGGPAGGPAGGHPGFGTKQDSSGIERFAIAAYTLSTSGEISLTNTLLRIADPGTTSSNSDGINVQVYVNDTLITSAKTLPGFGQMITFDSFLGNLNLGDRIYVAVGGGDTNNFDSFELAYSIVREPTTNAIDVTSTESSGPGTLRDAIIEANTVGSHVITFGATTGLGKRIEDRRWQRREYRREKREDRKKHVHDGRDKRRDHAAGCPFTIILSAFDGPLPPLTDPNTTIDGSPCGVTLDGSALAADDNIGLLVSASNITIRGLTIEGFSGPGIQIDPGVSGATLTGVVVSKNVIRRNGGDGVLVVGGEGPGNTVGVTIVNNKFEENEEGITVSGSSTGSVGGNTVAVVIDSNKIKESFGGDGIRVVGDIGEGSSNIVTATISNNDVKDNANNGILVAGAIANASGNYVTTEIVHNDVNDNGDNGIVVRGGSSSNGTSTNNALTFVIANNESEDNDGDGILVDAGRGSMQSATGTIAKNEVEDSGKRGISLRGRSDNTLHDIAILENDVSGSGQLENDSGYGIRISIGSSEVNAQVRNITLKGNESSRNNRDGINVFRSSTMANVISVTGITDNETNKNGRDGIRIGTPRSDGSRKINGSGATPISANRADENGDDGIEINGVGYVVLANEADDNAGDGINVEGNVNGGGNTASGNALCNGPAFCF